MQSNKDLTFVDMATATRSFIYFSGEENEDVVIWIRDAKTLGWAMSMEENSLLKFLIVHLKGKALSWFLEQINNETDMNLETFTIKLKERFSSEGIEDRILNRFLNINIVSTREDFKRMIEDATRIKEGGIINIKSLVKQFIVRCPPELKSYLFQAAFNSWTDFIRAAENAIWMAFPDKTVSKTDILPEACIISALNKKVDKYSKKRPLENNKKNEKECIIHGKKGHSTEECYPVVTLEKAGWKKAAT